jgi:hypothetical protein
MPHAAEVCGRASGEGIMVHPGVKVFGGGLNHEIFTEERDPRIVQIHLDLNHSACDRDGICATG